MNNQDTPQRPELGGLEFEVMEVLWAHGESNVRSVLPHLSRARAYTTVMTALERLFRKGFAERRRQDQGFVYWPAITREEWMHQVVGDLITASKHPEIPIGAASFLVEVVCQDDPTMLEKLLQKIEAKRRELDKGEAS